MKDIKKDYGCYTFNDVVMKERLPKNVYKAYHEAIVNNESLSKENATIIANTMKLWAIEMGATHYTHWFSPLNGLTAEKHNSFIELDKENICLEFNYNHLIKGESDASSFPSGGLRNTFEARGYTAWDLSSPAFIKDESLYIPTLFYSYNGEALDNKIPLLKSCASLNKEAVRLLKLLGLDGINCVSSYVGSEQEYFLVDEKYYKKRMDLKFTGRTIFGAATPKDQKTVDHYYGSINPRILKYMQELDKELWKYGIPSKTRHNEAAPSQHELACIYRSVNITTDNNQLVMQLMQDIAKKNGLRCLLHEKPFLRVNGSGKHNNWSIITNNGLNLFDPGDNAADNIYFLASVACLVRAVDKYSDLLTIAISTAGNDLRLGGHEAPPNIISMYLGEELNQLIEAFVNDDIYVKDNNKKINTGVNTITDFTKDSSDRNRTSPFAFTGNKFEFRGVGSSQSVALINIMLNSILAYSMKEMADEIESGANAKNIIKKYFNEHKRIIFDGDGYSKEWIIEAKKRGLSNHSNSLDAIECLKNKELVKPLISLGIYSEIELKSRYDILLENYSKTIITEALTALLMIKKEILPACIRYMSDIDVKIIEDYSNNLKELINSIYQLSKELENKISLAKMKNDIKEKAFYCKENILFILDNLRIMVDKLELEVDKKYWPMPTYEQLLYGID